MDATLEDAFAHGLKVSTDKNDTSAPHPRLAQYKSNSGTAEDGGQEYRRAQMFERQKKRRLDAANYARRLVEGDLNPDDIEDEIESSEQIEKRFNPYKNQLMLSEWLVEVPEDFTNEWVMTVCPVGKRCLVVANKGSTSVYTKSGYCVNRFPSLLPGGSKKTVKPGEYSIMDCIYNEGERTFYIIDLTCWKGHPIYDSETEFRFYWLQTKFTDQHNLDRRSRINPYIFTPVPYCGCTVSEIQAAVTATYSFQVDGLLFYHKRTHYTPGRTPLVGWLKPFMIPEILGINLPDYITADMPAVNKLTMLKANNESFRHYGTGSVSKQEDMDTQNEFNDPTG